MFLANRSTVNQGPKCPIMLDVMRPRIFFLNVGWMTAYRGLTKGDTITGGGQHVRDYGSGGEIFNFMPYGGRCYGYGRPANDTIALERLGAPEGSDYVDGILVVWVAKSCVVGWYKNARVYRKWQPSPSGSRRVSCQVRHARLASLGARNTLTDGDWEPMNRPSPRYLARLPGK